MSIIYLDVIIYVQTFLSAFVAFCSFLKFKKRPLITKLIGLSFAIGCIANLVSQYLHHNGLGKLSNPLFLGYEVANFFIICLIFNIAFKTKYFQLIYYDLFPLFLLFALFNFFFLQKAEALNTLTYAVGSLFIMVLCIMFFYRLMIDLPTYFVHRMPMFLFNSAFLVYCSGTLILFIVQPYLVEIMNDDMITYWFFHNFVSVVEHIVVLIGIRQEFKYQISS